MRRSHNIYHWTHRYVQQETNATQYHRTNFLCNPCGHIAKPFLRIFLSPNNMTSSLHSKLSASFPSQDIYLYARIKAKITNPSCQKFRFRFYPMYVRAENIERYPNPPSCLKEVAGGEVQNDRSSLHVSWMILLA